jgi:NAD(P)-dependent dehydrogenase (short-subunit alcohol dehydrogenase family)
MISQSDLMSLTQKVALVTGGAAGIGAQIAKRLGEAGASVAIADVDLDAAEKIAEAIRLSGGIARGFAYDVGEVDDAPRIVEATVSALGRLDLLVNNAGISPLAPALDVTPATWDRVFAVNLKGPFFLTQCAAQQMIRQNSAGSIVNITAIDTCHPSGKLACYEASKAGMEMMTRSLAFELAKHRIRVNAVAPGVIHTPGADAALAHMGSTLTPADLRRELTSRVPLGRLGEPDDIARAVLYLSSEASGYVTGSTLVVDGGYLLA